MKNPSLVFNQQLRGPLVSSSQLNAEAFRVAIKEWVDASLVVQRDVIYQVWKSDPRVFHRWLGHLRLATGFRAKKIARDPRQYHSELVSALATDYECAQRAFKTYFVNGRPDANKAFLARMEKLAATGGGASVEAVEGALDMARRLAPEGAADLFEASLRWIEPKWFRAHDLEPNEDLGLEAGDESVHPEFVLAENQAEDGLPAAPSVGELVGSSRIADEVLLSPASGSRPTALPGSAALSVSAHSETTTPRDRIPDDHHHRNIPALVTLWKEFQRYEDIQVSIRKATDTRNWKIETLLVQVREQEQTLARCEQQIRIDIGRDASGFETLELSDTEGVRLWLERAGEAYSRRDSRIREDFQKAKSSFLAECKRLGIEPPSSAETASTKNELDVARLEIEPKLAQERAFRSLRDGCDRSALAHLQSSQRAILYRRLEAEATPDWPASQILGLWTADHSVASEHHIARPAVTTLLRASLRNGEELPRGTWSLWVSLWGADAGEELQRAELAEAVHSYLTASSDTDELLSSFDGILSLPESLDRAIVLRRAKRLPADESVRALAKLSKEWTESTESTCVRQALLEALLRRGRWGEALLIATIGIRQGWVTSLDHSHTNAIFGALLANPSAVGMNSAVREMLDDPCALANQPEDILLYLGSALILGQVELATTCRYGNPKLFQKAEERWPALISLLLSTLEAPDEHERRRDQAARANELRWGFEHDLGKSSAYDNWRPHGRKYQDQFRSYLKNKYDLLRSDAEMNLIDPEDILDRAHRTGLPNAQGNGRVAMLAYLRIQIGRLRKLQELANSFSSWAALDKAILFQFKRGGEDVDDLEHTLNPPTPLEVLIPHLRMLVTPAKVKTEDTDD